MPNYRRMASTKFLVITVLVLLASSAYSARRPEATATIGAVGVKQHADDEMMSYKEDFPPFEGIKREISYDHCYFGCYTDYDCTYRVCVKKGFETGHCIQRRPVPPNYPECCCESPPKHTIKN